MPKDKDKKDKHKDKDKNKDKNISAPSNAQDKDNDISVPSNDDISVPSNALEISAPSNAPDKDNDISVPSVQEISPPSNAPDKDNDISVPSVQEISPPAQEKEVSAQLVKELRNKTSAGMMDCKKALKESNGDIEKAIEWLRQKGLVSAGKLEGKAASEGLVDSYIHTGGRVGVLVEVNCQTDFVARNEAFKALVRNIAMQIAACPNVEYVKIDDIPPEVAAKEKAIEMGRDDLGNKPDNIKEKIVAGRIEKRLGELSLMDQAYIRDQNITVAELIKQNIAQLGENIQVRRFTRFILGEGLEKKESNFAEEVAAQIGGNQ